jgi:hypothetical protein
MGHQKCRFISSFIEQKAWLYGQKSFLWCLLERASTKIPASPANLVSCLLSSSYDLGVQSVSWLNIITWSDENNRKTTWSKHGGSRNLSMRQSCKLNFPDSSCILWMTRASRLHLSIIVPIHYFIILWMSSEEWFLNWSVFIVQIACKASRKRVWRKRQRIHRLEGRKNYNKHCSRGVCRAIHTSACRFHFEVPICLHFPLSRSLLTF